MANETTQEALLRKVGIERNYSIIHKVGEGGFGQVHLVQDKADEKQYVVKVIKGRTREEIEWAKKEIQILKRLGHPNIVLYKDDFEYEDGVIVIMEYCRGGDLAKLIKSRVISRNFFQETEIVKWLRQICEALQYLCSRNIIHRDLKPANIFLGDDDIIKLGDFGVSRQLVSSYEQATTIVGTPLYISPEMHQQDPYNHKSDVWSAGCSVYELMTFRTAIDPVMFCMTQKWEVREMPTNYSEGLCDVIKSMLTVDQSERPSVDEVLQFPILINSQQPNNIDTTRPEPTGETTEEPIASPQEEVLHDRMVNNEEEEQDLERTFYKVEFEDVEDVTIKPYQKTIQDQSTPTPDRRCAKMRLEELGYRFNGKGQLLSIESGEPFMYDKCENREANEKRYQQIAKVVNEYVGDLLETELKMSQVTLPVDCARGEPLTFIYATSDFLMNRDKLLILVGGGEFVRAGLWSRKVVINDSLDKGSHMPVIKRAIDEGYAVIILNQNQNDIMVDGVQCKVRENFDTRHHAMYVWDTIIIKNTRVKHIAFLTHSEGGRVVAQLAVDRDEYFRRLVFAVAFCNSKHDDVLNSAPKSVVDFFNSHSRNWMASSKPLNECINRVGLFQKGKDMRKVSAGDARPEWTVSSAKDAIFQYLADKYHQVTNTV